MEAIPVLKITPYYANTAQNRLDVAAFEKYVSETLRNAVSFSVAGDKQSGEAAFHLLDEWAQVNIGYSGKEACLYLVYKGQLLIQAASLISNRYPYVLADWVEGVYIPACDAISGKWNNWGMWGLCGAYMAQKYLGSSGSPEIVAIKQHIRRASLVIPFLSRSGELWLENLRNNSGMWYTCFYLNPVLKVAIMSGDEELKEMLTPLLDRFCETCESPRDWPYRAWPGVMRKVQRVLFPSEDEVDTPTPDNWAGNLLYVAGKEFENQRWTSYARLSDTNSVCMFRHYKEIGA